jgi:uncharacterized protein (TIGR02270 family)
VNVQPVRPIGFSPWEISALVNEEVVSQHAEEAAFLWTLRNRAVGEPHYSLKDLAELDERVEAHLDGLRITADVGWKYCNTNLEHLGPGELFAASVMAFGAGDRERMRDTLRAGCSSPKASPGLVSALGWLEFDAISPWVTRLLTAISPAHRAVGIRACAINRRDPGSVLASAADDADPVLRASALRAIGELKRNDLSNLVHAQLASDDPACRFWAAWALTLNGSREGISELSRWFETPGPFGLRALQVGLRAMHLEESRRWISTFASKSELARQSVIGAGIVGDPTSIPWLIKKMESAELARLAGEAFTMMTGVDLAYHDLDQDPTARDGAEDVPIEEVLELDYESNLPWPSAERLERWWRENQHTFSDGIRHLAGKPITSESLQQVLATGKQRQRAAAALELALLRHDMALFEVRSPGKAQLRVLASWS